MESGDSLTKLGFESSTHFLPPSHSSAPILHHQWFRKLKSKGRQYIECQRSTAIMTHRNVTSIFSHKRMTFWVTPSQLVANCVTLTYPQLSQSMAPLWHHNGTTLAPEYANIFMAYVELRAHHWELQLKRSRLSERPLLGILETRHCFLYLVTCFNLSSWISHTSHCQLLWGLYQAFLKH